MPHSNRSQMYKSLKNRYRKGELELESESVSDNP
jgi:hypothetical protein